MHRHVDGRHVVFLRVEVAGEDFGERFFVAGSGERPVLEVGGEEVHVESTGGALVDALAEDGDDEVVLARVVERSGEGDYLLVAHEAVVGIAIKLDIILESLLGAAHVEVAEASRVGIFVERVLVGLGDVDGNVRIGCDIRSLAVPLECDGGDILSGHVGQFVLKIEQLCTAVGVVEVERYALPCASVISIVAGVVAPLLQFVIRTECYGLGHCHVGGANEQSSK